MGPFLSTKALVADEGLGLNGTAISFIAQKKLTSAGVFIAV
jgi:hypothetical protein